MLLFYYNPNDSLGDEIQSLLTDNSTAHKAIRTENSSYLKENDLEIHGRNEILEFLQQYIMQQQLPHIMSADSCRIDPETGKIC